MSTALAYAPTDLRTAEGMLQFVDGCEDRETWIYVGLVLKGEYGDNARDAWIQWSSSAHNYSEKSCLTTWRGLKPVFADRGIGGLVNMAKAGGYKFDKTERKPIDPAEVNRKRMERAQRAEQQRLEKQQAAAKAETVALQAWRAAQRTGTSAYATRKGIDAPESCRFIPAEQGGGLVVPMLRYDLPREQSLKGVQTIKDVLAADEDTNKKFTWGMDMPGTACRLGLPVVGEPVFVCEGYATGMSIRMALERRYPVFVAFTAGNLPLVVESVHQALPGSPLVICADDDYKTVVRGVATNVGRIQAQEAMDNVMDAGAKLVVRTFPLFRKETARGDKDSDFNDLHRLEGLPEVTNQLQVCLDTIQELKKYG